VWRYTSKILWICPEFIMRLPASLISCCTVLRPRLLFSRRIFFEPELESVAIPKHAMDPAEELRNMLYMDSWYVGNSLFFCYDEYVELNVCKCVKCV
jgi:hypothetical protein